MGYDLHITRKSNWTDETGPTISADEWRSVLEAHPELSDVLSHDGAEITAKNPDESLGRLMVQIAGTLGAQVQGDDGEIYGDDGSSFEPEPPRSIAPREGLLSKIGTWFKRRNARRELEASGPAFRNGQRVKNLWGVLGTVVNVDKKANAGMGSLRVRYDDGTEAHVTCTASPFEIVSESSDGPKRG